MEPSWTRDEAWREAMAARFGGLAVSADGPVGGGVVSTQAGTVSVHAIRGEAQVLVRSASAVRRRPADLVKASIVVRGTMLVDQDDRIVRVRAGQLGLYDTGRPYRLRFDGPWEVRVVTVPRTELALADDLLDRAMIRPLPAATGVGGLTTEVVDAATSAAARGKGPDERLHEAALALVAGTVTAATGAADGLLSDICRYVDEHLELPLSPRDLAVAHHQSLRTVQRVLREAGTSPAALVRHRRLEAVRRDLADPRLAHVPIGAIAARHGIVDQPWLSRAFRSEFGLSPSEARLTQWAS